LKKALAIDEALKSIVNQRHGAVLIYKGKVVGKGHNQHKKEVTVNIYMMIKQIISLQHIMLK